MPEPFTKGYSVDDWRSDLVTRGYFDTVKVVVGELGPIEVLGSPMVVVAVRNGSTFVWLERSPWGWEGTSCEFLGANSPSAQRFAMKLAIRVRDATQAEHDRICKKRTLRDAEREAVRRSRGFGA